MTKKIDLTGQRFGKLLVLSDSGERYSASVIWNCKCDCGNIIKIITCNLKRAKSCGKCRFSKNLNSEKLEKKYGKLTIIGNHFVSHKGYKSIETKCECGKIKFFSLFLLKSGQKSCGRSCSIYRDIKGMKFGRLTAIEKKGKYQENIVWKCLCECGTYKNIKMSNLVKGSTKSCGCLRKESFEKTIKSENPIYLKCGFCEKKFITFIKNKKYCSENCRTKNNYKLKKMGIIKE